MTTLKLFHLRLIFNCKRLIFGFYHYDISKIDFAFIVYYQHKLYTKSIFLFWRMTTKTQIFTPKCTTRSTKLLTLKEQEKINPNEKKIFSRKPLNSTQSSIRLMPNRIKIQNQEDSSQLNEKVQENHQKKMLAQSKNMKFLSSKSSTSLQKLLITQSMTRLPCLSKEISIQRSSISRNKIQAGNNQYQQNIKNFKLNKNKLFLSVIVDEQNLPKNASNNNEAMKYSLKSTDMSSSNDNHATDDSCEYQGNRKMIEKYNNRSLTSSICFTTKNMRSQKNCFKCAIYEQKTNQLQDQNRNLLASLNNKNAQIKKLQQKIERLSKNLKNSEQRQSILNYQVKLLKQRNNMICHQKEELQELYRQSQINFNKVYQQIRYKQLQNNINKMYRNKCHQMELQVVSLRQDLMRSKKKCNVLKSSRSIAELKPLKITNQILSPKNDMKKSSFVQQKLLIGCIIQQQKKTSQKQPKLTRIYSEDTIFSLSSEQND